MEAIELQNLLEPHGITLTRAVRFYLDHAPTGSKKTVTDLIPEYLRTKTDPDYRKAQAISLGVFARDFGSKPIASIFAPAIEKWFGEKDWQPLNARNYMRDLSMFFRWAVVRDYVSGNPFDKVKRPKMQRRAPEIYSIDEARQILETAALRPELDLLPMYSVALFSGVRVEELGRMRWEMIDWEEGEIRLPAEITKTGSPRNIEICDALRWWLEGSASREGALFSPTNLRQRREKLLSLAEVPAKRNALRHSFASYHAAKLRNPGLLQLLSPFGRVKALAFRRRLQRGGAGMLEWRDESVSARGAQCV